MAIANVALTDTFDVWRVRTNQLINVYDETNQLARASYNATNLAIVTSSNIAANIISGNSAVYNTIYSNANTITYNIMSTLTNTTFVNLYASANAAFNVANASLATANLTYDQANTARDTSNTAFDSMNIESNIIRTIANLSYDTANSFVSNASNSVAEVLASNTIIQNIVNTTTNTLVSAYLANVSFTYIGNIANNAYDKANNAGGGYFAGNNGYTGNANNISDIFRINTNTFTGNIVFSAGMNASATGPLYMEANSKLEIQVGARVVIL